MNKDCPDCKGTTWIQVLVNGRKIGRRCRCYLNEEKNRLIKASRIPHLFSNCSIGNFDVLINRDFIGITDQIRKYITKFPGDQRGLLMVGPPGVGKTHLAVGIIHYLIEDKGVHCLFYNFRELLNEIRSTYDRNSQLSEKSIIEPLLKTELLVLDELGAEKTSDWVLDILMYILNYRYTRQAPTVITTNYPDALNEFKYANLSGQKSAYRDRKGGKDETLEDRIGIRLRSRLYEMCEKILMDGEDYRKRKQESKSKRSIRELL